MVTMLRVPLGAVPAHAPWGFAQQDLWQSQHFKGCFCCSEGIWWRLLEAHWACGESRPLPSLVDLGLGVQATCSESSLALVLSLQDAAPLPGNAFPEVADGPPPTSLSVNRFLARRHFGGSQGPRAVYTQAAWLRTLPETVPWKLPPPPAEAAP